MTIWDQKYSTSDFLYGEHPNTFLVEQSSILKPRSKILCLAEGEGRNAVYLAKLGHQVTAIDLSQVGLDKLKKLAGQHQVSVETICCDLAHYPFQKEQFDAVISIWCHLPPLLRKEIHQKVYETLKPNGFFILEAYTLKQLEYRTGGPSEPSLMMSIQSIQDDFKKLHWFYSQELERYIEEGSGHKGQSAVLQVVGQKKEIV